MPTWNHLWFVAHLWIYTFVLAGIAALPVGTRAQAWFDRAFGGWRALVLPVLYLVLLAPVTIHRIEDTHDLIRDGMAPLRHERNMLVQGKSGAVTVDLGGRHAIQHKT